MEDMVVCKWFWLAVAVIALSIAWYKINESKNERDVAAACAPAGLVQKVDEGHVIWVRPPQERVDK